MRTDQYIATIAAAALLGITTNAGGADHYDGDETVEDPAGDIADFYAFPDGDALVLVMNVHPRAGKEAFFSDVIEYGFRIRPATLQNSNGAISTEVGNLEQRITCTFTIDDPETSLSMTAHCGLSESGELLANTSIAVDDTSGGTNPGLQVFAGLRSDPFFTDAGRIRLPRPRYGSLPRVLTTGNAMRADRIALGVLAGGPDSTKGNLPNVLSLVVKVDTKLLSVGSQMGVVAETNRLVGGQR